MAFVPGQTYDLFLSYDRFESAWVNVFRTELLKEFQARTGKPFTFWQDTNQIQGGQKWYEEIQNGIRQSAAFLAIISPSYHTSVWCKEERRLFLEEHGGDWESLKVESEVKTLYRFLKMVKAPGPEDAHKLLLQQFQNIEFFDSNNYELPADSQGFTAKIREAERAIRELLTLLSNHHQSLYVAPVLPELSAEREQMRHQLGDLGYNIRPRIELSEEHDRRLLMDELEKSTAAIFLLGGSYDRFIETQIEMAQEFGRQMIFWIHPGNSKQPDPKQASLISRIRDHKDLPSDTQVLGGPSIWLMVHDHLLSVLASRRRQEKSEALPGDSNGIYLLYDSTLPQESQAARQITEILGEQKLAVVGSGTNVDHQRQMRTSKAVLLFRAASQDPDLWLNSYIKDVAFSQAMFEKQPDFQAKAALVSKPQLVKHYGVPVIAYDESFNADRLAPFLQQIRQSDGAYGDR